MIWESALAISAEVGIGIAGFAGIVAALKHRDQAGWSASDLMTLELLIAPAASAIFASLIPYLIIERLGEDNTWRLMSLGYVLLFSFVLFYRLRQYQHKLRNRQQIVTPMIGSALVIPVSLANIVWWHSFEGFYAIVLMELGTAFVAFTQLLRSTRQG